MPQQLYFAHSLLLQVEQKTFYLPAYFTAEAGVIKLFTVVINFVP
jgi:hypothetical protein